MERQIVCPVMYQHLGGKKRLVVTDRSPEIAVCFDNVKNFKRNFKKGVDFIQKGWYYKRAVRR